MNQNIEIPSHLYLRLSGHAKGFDTPANVIERILDFFEEKNGCESKTDLGAEYKSPLSLEIVYHPSNEEKFKQTMLKTKRAFLLIYKSDGSKEMKEWNASNITNKSSINGNLRSGYLRGWKKKGIIKVELSANQDDLK